MPSMNPDGFELAYNNVPYKNQCINTFGRYNGNPNISSENARWFHRGRDLNRNFKPPFFSMEPESRAVRRWIMNNPFVLSVSFHGGTEVVIYPPGNKGTYFFFFTFFF